MFFLWCKLLGFWYFFFFLQNLSENPKCSLLVAKDPEDRTDTVITVYGDATPVMLQILACLYPWFFSVWHFPISYCSCYVTNIDLLVFVLCLKGFRPRKRCSTKCILTKTSWGILGMLCGQFYYFGSTCCFMKYWFLMKKMPNKVDFGDFRFLHIKPKAVRYVSGVATAILGSGGMLPSSLP